MKRYLEFINESKKDEELRGVLEQAYTINKLLKDNLDLTLELHNEGHPFLYKFDTPLDINVTVPYVSYGFQISFDKGETFKRETKKRDLNDKSQADTLLEDLIIIKEGIGNEKLGYATDITNSNRFKAIKKVIK